MEDKLKQLYDECVTDAHLAANLYPRTEGKGLSGSQVDKVMDFLGMYAGKLGIDDAEDVCQQAVKFRTVSTKKSDYSVQENLHRNKVTEGKI